MFKYIGQLLTNNTGKSSKTFAVVITVVGAALVLLCTCMVLIVDLFTNYKVESDLYGIAAIIGAVGTLLVAVIYGKIKGEEIEYKYPNDEDKLLK